MMDDSGASPLTREQIMGGLLPEFGSTQFVLDTGIRLLRESVSFARDKDAIFATLAVGVEKVVKLSLGIMAIDAGRPWPSGEIWGHRSAKMDAVLRDSLRGRIAAGGFSSVAVAGLSCTGAAGCAAAALGLSVAGACASA